MQFPICSTDTKRPDCGTVKPLNDLCRNNTVPERLWTAGADSAVQFNLTGAARPWASRHRHGRALFIILWDDLHLDWTLGAILWRPDCQPGVIDTRDINPISPPAVWFPRYQDVIRRLLWRLQPPKLTTSFRYQRLKLLSNTGSDLS
jgi:hypothetical protein